MLQSNFLLYCWRSFLILQSRMSYQLLTLECIYIQCSMLLILSLRVKIYSLIEALRTCPMWSLLIWYFYSWYLSRIWETKTLGFGLGCMEGSVFSAFRDYLISVLLFQAAFFEEVLAINIQSLRVILLQWMTREAKRAFCVVLRVVLGLVTVRQFIVLFLSEGMLYTLSFLKFLGSCTRFVAIVNPSHYFTLLINGSVPDLFKCRYSISSLQGTDFLED